jgi:hypothetical protein
MGQTISNEWGGVNRVVAWPLMIVNDFNNDSSAAAAGVVVGAGALYFTLGNPLELLEKEQWVNLAVEYGIFGAGYFGGYTLLSKYENSA